MKNSIPKIRFKEYTDVWNEKEFSEFAKYRNGKAHENDIIPNGKYIVVNSKFCSTNGIVKKYSNKQNEPLYRNEIAFVLSDVPNGKALARTYLIEKDNKYTLNQRIAGITPLDNTNPYFLYILMNRNKYFLQFDDGAKQTNLSNDDVLKFKDFFPIKEEQEKIGNVFKNIDHLINLTKVKYINLNNLKKSLLDKMLPQKDELIPKIRFKEFNKEWTKKTINDYGTFYYGKSAPKWSVTENASIPCVRYGELYTKFGNKIEQVFSYTNMPKEKLVFSKGTEVLVPRVGEDPFDYNHCTWLSIPNVAIGEMISVYNTEQNPLFTATMFNATLKYEFAKRVEGGSVTNLYYEKLKDIFVTFPDKNEQEKIAEYFSNIDKLLKLYDEKLNKLLNLKTALLDKMFV